MSNPFIPFDPPGDTTNRTPKMLSQRTKKIVNGEPVPSTGTAKIIIPPEDLTFRAASRFGMRLNAMPAADTVYFPYQRRKYNARAYNKVRIGVDVYVAGAAGSHLRVQWTTTPLVDGSWQEAGRLGGRCLVPIDVVGPWVSDLLDSEPASRLDVWWRVIGGGGDGDASPVIGMVYVQFDMGEEVIRDRWYWRNASPSVTPGPVPENLWVYPSTFWGCEGWPQAGWTTPSPETARTTPKIFKREKGNLLIATGFGVTYPFDQQVHSGPAFVIVGAPLQAQEIPAFDYQTAWAGIGGGGNNTAHLTTQLHLYRESTDEFVYSSLPVGFGATWFRYIPRSWTHGIPMTAMTAEEGDRFVLWGSISMELVCSAFADNGGFISVGYNGDGAIPLATGDASSYWANAASYTDFPKLRYVTEDA